MIDYQDPYEELMVNYLLVSKASPLDRPAKFSSSGTPYYMCRNIGKFMAIAPDSCYMFCHLPDFDIRQIRSCLDIVYKYLRERS